ncbi:MAG: endonuclease [Opitutales bacterium]|nr:endonuclease [Opitutales bacterium]
MFFPDFRLVSRGVALFALIPLFCLPLSAADWSGNYDSPAAYYEDAEGLFGDELRDALHGIIAPHNVLSYNDVTLAVRVLDEDPDNPDNLLLIYSGISVPKTSNWVEWNREHTWPRSFGASEGGPAFSDFHHMYPCNPGVNSRRSNYSFDWLPNGNPDPGAPGSKVDGSRNLYEPRDEDKGRVGRLMMYMDVRYDGSDVGTLNLTLGTTRDNFSPDIRRFGNLPALLEWNRMFPPDFRERRRNHLIYDGFLVGNRLIVQGNRNPFIDYPDLADALFTADLYRTWGSYKAMHFPMEVWNDPEWTDPLLFADASPVPMLFEFSQDLAPGTGERGNLPFVARTSSGRISYFHFTELREHARSGVEYFVEYSETPLTEDSWQTYSYTSAQVLVTGSTDFARDLRVSDLGLPGAERTRHFRLRVDMNYPVDDPTGVVFDPVGTFNESGSIFAYFEAGEEGLRETDWWGQVDDGDYPFVTQEHHGDLWVSAEDEEAVWVHDPALGWLFTGRLVQPHFYSVSADAWITFIDATTRPQRWFYDWSSETFRHEGDLRP